ncbi:MAG: VWA domain-containing protein [Pseudomonadota bacterium]
MPWPRIAFLLAFPALSLAPQIAAGQERSYLLIDASGSMWGQIDGKSKIEILRENMRDVMANLKGASEVGVYAFGHREKGACGDIEEVSPLRPFDGEAISRVIEGISPKGKTPLAEALRETAEALKYTEEKAKVVILGDGEDSCEGDPCAVAQELEKLGVEFTVDAIAFDIAGEEGVEALRCIARVTGGEFIAANDKEELRSAIEKIAVSVAPKATEVAAPAPKGVRLIATGVEGDIEWTLIDKATETVTVVTAANGDLRSDIPPGDYDVFASAGDAFGEAEATIAEGELTEIVIALSAATTSPLTISRESAPAGSVIDASWTIEPADKDIVFISPKDDPDNRYPLDRRAFHDVQRTSSGRLVTPAEPGRYEVRYFRFASGGVLYRSDLLVTAAQVEIAGPETISAGEAVSLSVDGPQAPGDFVFIAPKSWRANQFPSSTSERAAASGEVRLRAPRSPGPHEYRYFSAANGVSLFSKAVEVVVDAARVSTVGEVSAGSVIEVDFSGPRHPKDVLFITPEGSDERRYLNGAEQRRAAAGGAPARLVAPSKAGTYEVRYFSPDRGGLLAKARIAVGPADVTLDAPRVAQRGEAVSVAVTGPGAPDDVVFIAESGWSNRQYPSVAAQRQTVRGSSNQTKTLLAPSRPGTYEIRYFSWSNGDVLARRKIIVR